MKKHFLSVGDWISLLIGTFIICSVGNCYLLLKLPIKQVVIYLAVLGILYVALLLVPSIFQQSIATKKLKRCAKGCLQLLLFLTSLVASCIVLILGCINGFMVEYLKEPLDWVFYFLILCAAEALVFWNGISRVYLSSSQLGMKWRVIGLICGWIPILNLIALGKILQIVESEVMVEHNKIVCNRARQKEQICATRYPILMVHGVFFRDFQYFNYWGRIPQELGQNGATIFYGNHQSALSVAESGKELAGRIQQIILQTGCEKVNIIAHSKGGLDSRYAIAMCGAAQYVASLTTINTPHRGCEFADYLLSKVPQKEKDLIASSYNNTLRKLGDSNPDFIGAVTDLTASACSKINETVLDSPLVYYQSVGSTMRVSRGGRFPLNLSHKYVRSFDGANDGLVGEKSFPWGSNFQMLSVSDNRGISHGDMIDLNRENLPEFDVREFFVQCVADLKKKGF